MLLCVFPLLGRKNRGGRVWDQIESLKKKHVCIIIHIYTCARVNMYICDKGVYLVEYGN